MTSAKTLHRTGASPSVHMILAMGLFAAYALLPLVWLVINSTKTLEDLFTVPGLSFGRTFALWDNIAVTLTYDDGAFLRWAGNTLLYVAVGAGGATLLAALGGYGLAKFQFAGRGLVFAAVIGAIAIPGTALAVPTFLLFSQVGLTNTPWAIILPSLISPFGLYLVWAYAAESVPTELIEAARVDGAGEYRIFFTIVLHLLGPVIATVALFNIVATWNNYFLPLIMLSDEAWYPLTVGLNQWNQQASQTGGEAIFHLVITGSLLTILPIVITFFFMQRYWVAGLSAGSVRA